MPFRYLKLTVNTDDPTQVDIHYVCKKCGEVSPPATRPFEGWTTNRYYSEFWCEQCSEENKRSLEQFYRERKLGYKIKKWVKECTQFLNERKI